MLSPAEVAKYRVPHSQQYRMHRSPANGVSAIGWTSSSRMITFCWR